MDNFQASLDAAFRALADPTRRAVIQQLSRGPASVTELAAAFDMALPSFMKHIKVLQSCGLISSRKVGRVRTCKLKPRQLQVVERWLSQLWEGPEA